MGNDRQLTQEHPEPADSAVVIDTTSAAPDEAAEKTLAAIGRSPILRGRVVFSQGNETGADQLVEEVDAWLIDPPRAERVSRILARGHTPPATAPRIIGVLFLRRGPVGRERLLVEIPEAWWTGPNGEARRIGQSPQEPEPET